MAPGGCRLTIAMTPVFLHGSLEGRARDSELFLDVFGTVRKNFPF